jgi:hypothetical protein
MITGYQAGTARPEPWLPAGRHAVAVVRLAHGVERPEPAAVCGTWIEHAKPGGPLVISCPACARVLGALRATQ